MIAQRDKLRRMLAECLEREVGLKNTLRRVIDHYSDATAAETADALRPVNEEPWNTARPSGTSAMLPRRPPD